MGEAGFILNRRAARSPEKGERWTSTRRPAVPCCIRRFRFVPSIARPLVSAALRIGKFALMVSAIAALAAAPACAQGEPVQAPTAKPSSHSLLDTAARERRVAAQAVEAEVSASLRSARARIGTQPAEVYHDLSIELDRVRKSKDLEAPDRARLAAQIRGVMLQASRQASSHSELNLRTQELNAAQYAEAQRVRDITVEQQRAQRALTQTAADIQHGQYEAAVDSANRAAAFGSAPGASTAAAIQARTSGRYSSNLALQGSRNYGYLATTDAVASSAVPISDLPGVQYPSAEEWKAKTAAREKYATTFDMHRVTPGEAKIEAALKQTSSLDCDQMPLADVIAYLRARNDIEIQLDRKGLADVGVDTSTAVTMHVKGIKLKSILKLLCDELELSSVRRDDILLITSKEKAAQFNVNRVYYVGPEVMDPRPIMMGGFGAGF
jgi:hypothetical protein